MIDLFKLEKHRVVARVERVVGNHYSQAEGSVCPVYLFESAQFSELVGCTISRVVWPWHDSLFSLVGITLYNHFLRVVRSHHKYFFLWFWFCWERIYNLNILHWCFSWAWGLESWVTAEYDKSRLLSFWSQRFVVSMFVLELTISLPWASDLLDYTVACKSWHRRNSGVRSDIVRAMTVDGVQLVIARVFVRPCALIKSGVHNHFAFDLLNRSYVRVDQMISRLLIKNFVQRVRIDVEPRRFSVDQLLLTV